MDNTVVTAFVSGGFLVLAALINKGFFAAKTVEYDSDALIDSHISALGHKYGCQRISILGYHNGGKWYNGDSIKKTTIKHEYYNALHTVSVFHVMQGVSTGILKELPALLLRNDLVFEADIVESAKNVLKKPDYYKVMQEYGTIATVAVAVKRRIFMWSKMKFETVMVASIHFNWSEFNNQWTKSFVASEKDRLPFCNDINLLLTMFDKKHIRKDALGLMEKAVNQVI
jgi:hypothetical protein